MTPEARALAGALLDHHKQVCRSSSSQSSDVDSSVVTYGDLCDRSGLPHVKPLVGKFLREIAQWCHENGWPPLNSLAVNHETRKPGHGYHSAPGCSLERWHEQVAACLKFTGYPELVC